MSNEFPVAKALSAVWTASGLEFDDPESLGNVEIGRCAQGRPPGAVLVAADRVAVDPEKVPEPPLPARGSLATDCGKRDAQQGVPCSGPVELDDPAHRGEGSRVPGPVRLHRLTLPFRRNDVRVEHGSDRVHFDLEVLLTPLGCHEDLDDVLVVK